ncbi:MAG: hypothetical protein KAJ73_09025 [Zetaproteobacteria bacterium]|nr:hypothetical protein [Zetaproteobacteria bacterium]
MRRHVVLDRFNGKPLVVTITRNGEKREYMGEQADRWAKFFALHPKQTFVVIPNF